MQGMRVECAGMCTGICIDACTDREQTELQRDAATDDGVGNVAVARSQDGGRRLQPHGYILAKQQDEAGASRMGGHSAGMLLARQRRLLRSDGDGVAAGNLASGDGAPRGEEDVQTGTSSRLFIPCNACARALHACARVRACKP